MKSLTNKDRDQLKILFTCHYVWAALILLQGISFTLIGSQFFNMQRQAAQMTLSAATSPEPTFGLTPALPATFFVIAFILTIALAIGNILSASFIKANKNRTFSFIIAILNFFSFPIGSALGIFTFVILSRDSIRDSYYTSKL